MNAPAHIARMNHGRVSLPRAFIICPHCQSAMIIRSSEYVTETVKNIYLHCLNVDCAFTGKWTVSPIHEICPSQMPNPAVNIPPCPFDYVRKAAERRRGEQDPNQMLMFPEATERIPAPG